MKGADAIANILKREGVDFIGCIPFSTLTEAVAVAGVRPIIFRQERVGVNMADGFSRTTGGRRVGAFTMQAQAGAENAFAGVAQAYADSVPILLLPAAAGRSRTGVRPNFSPTRSYRDVTKWVDQINLVERVPEMMRRAFSQLRIGRPSPVMLDLPADILSAELDEADFHYVPVVPRRTAGDPADVAEAARALLAAKRPVIHAGQGILYAEAWDELRELAELLQVPVMTTLSGKSAFPEDHALSIGAGGAATTGPVVHFLKECDLVLGIGSSLTIGSFGVGIPEGKTIVHSTNDAEDINKDYRADHAVIGDSKLVLRQLLQEVRSQGGSSVPREGGEVVREVKAVKGDWLKEWMPKLTSDEVPINPYRVVWDLMHTLDRKNTIITHDSGSPRDQMSPFFDAIAPRTFIGWGKSTQLGYGFGLAMGAKLAEPDKLAVNVMGDAAFGMVGLDFETAIRESIPILTIVNNNSGMGIYGPDRFPVAAREYGTGRLSGNYAEVAAALGGYNERVERPQEVVPAVRRAQQVVASGQPALVEIITSLEPAFSFRGWG